MTIEKAIYQLTDLIKDRESFMVGDYDKSIYDRDKEALQTAITALEKQVPKKVLNLMINADGKPTKVFKGICPYCQCIVNNGYCSRCGQALDWSDNDE